MGAQLLGIEVWSRAQGSSRGRLLFWLGLGLLAGSLALMMADFGVALGLCWALLMISLVAYIYRFVPRLLPHEQVGKDAFKRRNGATRAARGGKAGLALRLVSAGPLYLVAAMAIGAVAATKLPWEEVNRLMFGGLIIPAIWAAGALHATADLKVWRVLASPIALTAVFTGIFFAT